MDMPSVMPRAEKPDESRHTSGKVNAAKRHESDVVDNEMFSELLLMVSASGNNKAMSQMEGPILSSGLNHSSELLKAQGSQFESVPLVRHSNSHNEESEEERVLTDMADGYFHSPGAEISLPATGDSGAYKGAHDREAFRDDFNRHIEQCHDLAADVMPEIIPNLAPEITTGNSNEVTRTHMNVSRPDIMSQLSDRLVDLYHIGGHSAKIRLQPDELGHLHIDLSVVDDSIKAIVTVEEGSVKDIIEANMDMLVEELKGAGLSVDQFTVNIKSPYDDSSMAGGWSDGNSGRMFKDNILISVPAYEDTVMFDNPANGIYANSGGGISIFV